jgi:hypothetical protein
LDQLLPAPGGQSPLSPAAAAAPPHRQVGRLLLKLPLRKGMRTDDAESHQNLIFRLNR